MCVGDSQLNHFYNEEFIKYLFDSVYTRYLCRNLKTSSGLCLTNKLHQMCQRLIHCGHASVNFIVIRSTLNNYTVK